MTRRAAQLNIRSDAARQRVAELVAETGKSATQVVEDALRTYRPPPPVERPPAPDGLEWRGNLLVSQPDPRVAKMTAADHLAAMNEAREDWDPDVRRSRYD